MRVRATWLIAGLAVTAVVVPTATGAGGTAFECHGRDADFVGTPGPDRFKAGELPFPRPESIVVALRGGDDTLTTGPPSDDPSGTGVLKVIACGGGGADRLEFAADTGGLAAGGRGSDRVIKGGDLTNVEGGPLKLLGGAGPDRLSGIASLKRGGTGDDRTSGCGRSTGGAGDDRVLGVGACSDVLYGNRGDDFLKGFSDPIYPGKDKAFGGPGRDHCEAEIWRGCE